MRSIIRGLANDNGTLRGLTGQGEPGLATLLGGTSPELDSDQLTLGGGAGQVSSVSRLARANKDTRIAAVASGSERLPIEDEPILDPGAGIRPGVG